MNLFLKVIHFEVTLHQHHHLPTIFQQQTQRTPRKHRQPHRGHWEQATTNLNRVRFTSTAIRDGTISKS